MKKSIKWEDLVLVKIRKPYKGGSIHTTSIKNKINNTLIPIKVVFYRFK